MSNILNILYQDECLIAVNKPAGHLVHPADQPKSDDLVTMKILRDQLGQHVFPVHRLDRPTCGVLLFAKDEKSTRIITTAFQEGKVKKTYLAMIMGIPQMKEWECSEPIQKNEASRIQRAHTHFKILQNFTTEKLQSLDVKGLSLLEANPITGRFHQIRRHLLHSGFPIVGDYRYAGIEKCDLLGDLLGTGTRMLLQSKSLSFDHPITKRNIQIEAPLDEAFVKALEAVQKIG